MSIKTRALDLVLGGEGPLLSVNAGMPATEALKLAGDLMEGIHLLCEKLQDAINENNDLVHMNELRALGFLAETASALTCSVERSMRKGEGQ